MKLALQLVGLICLGSAAIHLATGFRTEFAFSMIGVAVCAIGVGYIDYIFWNPIALRKEADLLEQPVIEGYGS